MFQISRVAWLAACFLTMTRFGAASLLNTSSDSNIQERGAEADSSLGDGNTSSHTAAGQTWDGLDFDPGTVARHITVPQSHRSDAGETGLRNWGFSNDTGAPILREIWPPFATSALGEHPNQTIIGRGRLTHWNASIARNIGIYDPFLTQSVTFVVADAAFTAAPPISSAAFRVGSASLTPLPTAAAPEPAGMFLTGAGLFSLGFVKFQRHRR